VARLPHFRDIKKTDRKKTDQKNRSGDEQDPVFLGRAGDMDQTKEVQAKR
jgi:hypothetical protein